MTGLNRREFLRAIGMAGVGVGIGAGVGVPLISGVAGLGRDSSTGAVLASQRPLPPPFTVPLAVPPVLAPTRVDATTDYYEVVQRPAWAEILPGVRTAIWGYQGMFPGPTIRARSGRRVVVRQHNALPVPVVTHLHGGVTPADSDGYPTDLIRPAGQRDYMYPLPQRAATLWYHDHRMGFTGPTVWRGLAGFFLVRDDEEDALPLPRGDRDLPIMITDRSFAADGSLRYPSVDPSLAMTPGVTDPYSAGVLGDVILVNGRPWPVAEVRAVGYRLRVLNASNARRYRLALSPPPPGGGGLVQIGSDGGLLARPVVHDAIELAPAERFDLIVDFARYPVGQEVTLVNEFGAGPTRQVLGFRVGERDPSDGRTDSPIPDRLSTVAALDPRRAVSTRSFHFQDHGGSTGWTINGQAFAPTVVNATPRLGTMEIWRLVSDFHHPIHLHAAAFQVLSRGLSGPGPYDAGWKDTFDLRPTEEAAIAVRFGGYPGRYVFHCHNLEHEDMAMMGNFVTS